MGGRHYYLARELARLGYTVYVIAAGYTHLLRSPPVLTGCHEIECLDNVKYVWLRMPRYEEAHGIRRIFNWFLFSWRLRALARIIPDKPEAIICSSLSLISFLGARYLSRQLRARLIFEVRDIWPLTAIELGGYSPRHPFIRFLQWIEDAAYRQSDRVVSNLPNAVEHMISRGMDPAKFAWIPNGFSLSEVKQSEPLSVVVLNQLPDNKFLIGYTGTLGFANALDVLMEAAMKLREVPEIAIVLVGGGREKSRLQRFVVENKLSNVIFIDPIEKQQIQNMLAKFDVCYIGWRRESLYKYGIAPNKIAEYMYSGRPIIHSYSGFGDVIEECGAGITVPAEDSTAVADAVLKLFRTSTAERDEMGANGRGHAIANYEYGMLAKKLLHVIRGAL